MAASLPLPTLLSQAFVSFTVEFDNESEHLMPHWTTDYGPEPGSRQGPWLVSMVMWFNCLRFLTDEGVAAKELEKLARTATNLHGMRRWRYITISDGIIRPTAAGRKAKRIMAPLFETIENRWRERFGAEEMKQLRHHLLSIASRLELDLPDCLPILGYGLYCRGGVLINKLAAQLDENLPLVSLLSKCLLAFALEFEEKLDLSLAICANPLRVLDESGVRVRDLPALTGVSKEGIAMALGFMQKKLTVTIEQRVVRLTAEGTKLQHAYSKLLADLETRWRQRFGDDTIHNLRSSLEHILRQPIPPPYPDNWRTKVPKPKTLPHFPMVLHRGGYPDGS